jgi:potassium uptake TrkH family protein
VHPVRLLPISFGVIILVGAVLLMLPVSRSDHAGGVVMPALFTSVSAVCVTGLTTVDTPTFWSPFGQVVIMALVQVGGFGVMTLATMMSMLVGARLGVRTRLVVQTETHALYLGETTALLKRVAAIMLSCELVVAVVLAIRFRVAYDDDLGTAAWHGLFHSVTAFNNAGFALYSDNLIGFVGDGWIQLPLCAAVVVGGLGFPVVSELLRRAWRPQRWTVHTRITVFGSALLLAAGFLAVTAFEWSNPGTLGPLSAGDKILAGVTGSVMPRTAGFNSIDYGAATPETLAVTNLLMFVGGGSAGTAGGIKITTFFLLGFVIWAEVRGEADVTVGHRIIENSTQRLALTVALLGVAAVAGGTLMLLLATGYTLEQTLFEAVSAFATVGLTTGITFDLPVVAQLIVIALMFVGRVGTITVASALALRSRPRLYRLPAERPIVG